LVLMADGSRKPIDQVRPGDWVIAGDPQRGTVRPERVQFVIIGYGLKHLYDIHVDAGVIEATYNHPFWVVDKQTFVWAEDLAAGEPLLLADGRAPPITAVSHHDQLTTVYNLSISEIHTFYVGPESALVHNSCKLSLSTSDSWGDQASLADHYARHGGDFGATSPDEYASQASRFLQRSQAERLPTKIESDGTIRTYDPNTNEFGSYNPNGSTKTYYAPNTNVHGYPSNWDYWVHQQGREPWTP
jgi:hypothetical protein